MSGRILAIVFSLIIIGLSIWTCIDNGFFTENYNQRNSNYVSGVNYINPMDDEYSSWHVVGRASPITGDLDNRKSYVLQRDISRGLNRPSTVTNQYKYRLIDVTGQIVPLSTENPFKKLVTGEIVRSRLGSLKDNVSAFKVDLSAPNESVFWTEQPNKMNKLYYNNYIQFAENFTKEPMCNENNPKNILLDPVPIRGNRFRYNKAEQAQRLRYVFGTSYKVPNFSQRSTIGMYGTNSRPFEGQVKE